MDYVLRWREMWSLTVACLIVCCLDSTLCQTDSGWSSVTDYIATPFAPTLIDVSESPTVAVIGRNVTLRCLFSGNPVPAITWQGPGNTTLPIGRHALNSLNTEITISNIVATDEGNYTCTAENVQGSKTHAIHVNVEAVPRFLAVEDGPHNVSVIEGESYTFQCDAEAKPQAKIVWLQDGKKLDTSNPPTRFVLSNNSRSLTIINVCRDCIDPETKTDLMVIQCNASNVHGYIFAQGYLNVLTRTVVTILNETEVTVNVHEEGQVQFDCSATTDPSTPPTIQWFKVETDGDRLLHSDPTYVTVNDGLLSIDVAAEAIGKWPNYLGQYRCVAYTGRSNVSKTANITASEPGKTGGMLNNGRKATVDANNEGKKCGELLGLDVCWVWVSIVVTVFGLFLIHTIVCIVICQRNRANKNKDNKSKGNKRRGDKYKIVGREALRRILSSGTESSHSLYDTTAVDVGAGRNLVQDKPLPSSRNDGLNSICRMDNPERGTQSLKGFERGHRQSTNSAGTRSLRVGTKEAGRPTTTVHSSTQTENTGPECRCGQRWTSPVKRALSVDNTGLRDAERATSSTYAALQFSRFPVEQQLSGGYTALRESEMSTSSTYAALRFT